jgi:hypothetical protein
MGSRRPEGATRTNQVHIPHGEGEFLVSAIQVKRARLGGLLRQRKDPNDPDVLTARAELEEAVRGDREARRKVVQSDPELREIKLREAIKKEAESDPPLTHQQRVRLAALLLPPGHGHGTA